MRCEGGYCCRWSSVVCGRAGCSELLFVSFSLNLKLAKQCKIHHDAFDRRQVITYWRVEPSIDEESGRCYKCWKFSSNITKNTSERKLNSDLSHCDQRNTYVQHQEQNTNSGGADTGQRKAVKNRQQVPPNIIRNDFCYHSDTINKR